MRRFWTSVVCLALAVVMGSCLVPTADVKLYPNTENSPSMYLIQFSLGKALPSNSYLLLTMDWYTSNLNPYNCLLVNTTIAVKCTNLATPLFPLTITTTQVNKYNAKITPSKTIAILISSNMLAATIYSLQVHLYNVVPNIQKISPSIEMYTVSSNGLFYESNSNLGPVINNPPQNNLMASSILNDLSTSLPGDSVTLKLEVTIGKAVTTSLSTFLFVLMYPFSFSIGSIPSTLQAASYSTNPIPLYSKPTISSYEVISPNIFKLIFNEQFEIGRKFIVQINQISCPFIIASANISIYSLNYNTLTPLEAIQGLYPIKTTSYPLGLTLGLPYNPSFQGPVQFFESTWQYIQLQIQIPFTVPEGYAIYMKLTSAYVQTGTAFANFQSLNYTPVYYYFSNPLVNSYTTYMKIDSMGPIVVGSVISLRFKTYIFTSSLFKVEIYIDTVALINNFVSTNTYMYYGLVEGSGVSTSSFFSNLYDSNFGWTDRIRYNPTIVNGQYMYIHIYQAIGPTATSAGSYLQLYLSPLISVSPSFNQTNDCRVNWTTSTCLFSYQQTPQYLKLTIKASASYLAGNPNLFPHQVHIYLSIYNLLFPVSTSNKYIFPAYAVLYKSDVVNPTAYYGYRVPHVMPYYNQLAGASIAYINNFFTGTAADFQTYPGVIRFQSSSSSTSFNNIIVQPNNLLVIVFFANYGFRSFPTIPHMGSYPCTSNIGITCKLLWGKQGSNQLWENDQIIVFFNDTSYKTTNFHILIPDTQTVQTDLYFTYQIGYYDLITKDITSIHSGYYSKGWSSWVTTPSTTQIAMGGDILGKAGSYRNNVSLTVVSTSPVTGALSYLFLCTQWSFFQNGMTKYSASTLAMSSPATFGSNIMSPLAVYLTGGMYLTVIPYNYVSGVVTFTLWLDNAHMPYSYDLPNYYIYAVRQNDQMMDSANSYIMMNGGTFYGCPLQALLITCRDNAVGVVNTYCTVTFGTTNPLLANGNIRIALSGMTVATSTCYFYSGNTSIPVTCSSSTDNKNVTIAMSGWEFYPAGNFSLVFYGVGISNDSLSQSIICYLYDPSLMYVIESGVRLLTTTIASLSYIELSEIMYTYLNPLSSNTMTIKFYLPRPLYQDEQFAFVVGQDLSDVNTEVARLNILITRADGVVLYPLYTIDNINYLIVFSFTDPAQLTAGDYSMTIYGVLTPASQSNGAFNMIYRRTYDFTYTIANSANVIFPAFSALVISNISVSSLFNTEGYKQEVSFTIVNADLNVDSNMLWVLNFPSYYSPQLFLQDAYCMIDTAVISCAIDPNTPYQLIVSNSPKMVNAGTAYTITVIGLACPRYIYTNNFYPNRYIFVGVLQNSSSTAYAQRSLLLPYQNVQSMVTGVVTVLDMVGVSAGSLFAFSSIYAQFSIYCSVAISAGSYLYVDLPIQFDNLNNIPISAILIYGAAVNSSSTVVKNRRIQIPISVNMTLKSTFMLQFPNLPTPKAPCVVQMSEMIVTITPASKLSIYAASAVQGNSAPKLTFVMNSRYISFNYDQPIRITAGTYSSLIPVTSNDNSSILSNTNIKLQSTGFVFEPSTVFMPIGVRQGSFRIGADTSLVPVVYFYQAIKQEEVNTNYQITLNMNIQVTNDQVPIVLPASLSMPLGGCTNPFIIKLTNPPFTDLTLSYIFDNSLYSQSDFFPNPLTTPSQMTFTSLKDNNTFSFCSSTNLTAVQIAVTFYLSGTNYNSYSFSPSNQLLVNVAAGVPNVLPTVTLLLNNQQKTFLDVNFTNNVDSTIFYHMQLGQSKTPLSLQALQVSIKSNTWVLASQSDFLTHIYTVDIDNRIGQFFQTASTSTVRLSGLMPESFYTLCAYAVNVFNVASSSRCLQLSTMTWGSVMKATLKFSHTLTAQELNNILCYFTAVVGTSNLYMTDIEGNSCGNRSVANAYYVYTGSSFTTETKGTNIYLATNPTLTGTDPSPLAFMNLFSASGPLSNTALLSAQSMFSITYLTASYSNSYNARLMTSSSQANSLNVFFSTPVFNSATHVLTVGNVQIVGGVGTIYFVLVLYKQISVNTSNNSTYVSIRMNQAPTAEQVLNCQSWLSVPAEGCARAVYSGVSPLTVTFSGVQTNSLYLLYYLPASEFPMRPIVSGTVLAETVVTYTSELTLKMGIILLVLFMLQ